MLIKKQDQQPSLALAGIQAYMTQSDILVVQFPDDENRDGSRNVCSLAIQTLDAAARPRKLH
jgi:hypothetical protein